MIVPSLEKNLEKLEVPPKLGMTMADPVKRICDEVGVCREEALCYLDGFRWNLDSAMEACRNQTLPLSMVTDSRSIMEQQPCQLNDQSMEVFSEASVDDHLREIGRSNSQRVSLSGDETSKELMQYICPLMGLLSSSPSQFHVSKQDYLKQVKTESSTSSQSKKASQPITLNLSSSRKLRKVEPPSSREKDKADPPSQGTSREPEEQPMDPNSIIYVVIEPAEGGSTVTQGNAVNENRWPTYVKRCNEMIAFLTAATLAFVPIRYMIDAQKECGCRLQIVDYMEILLRFLEDFISIDIFIGFALAYAAAYIMPSASVPALVKRLAEAASIVFGFCVVFLVIFYISPVTFYLGLVSFGLSIGAITIREFRLV